ncbi:fimbrillin family protein [uncultured Porphyromonas sp.]|uniref:fimbrillin family protein n=1 Tax=uncultured Porphyromonas sp. TaxID=159274 RepID=UPI002805515F|nr:fimbrillin family protein [uncultured Porphyromonas sp.]
MNKLLTTISILLTTLLLATSCTKEQSRCNTCPDEDGAQAKDYIVFKSNIRLSDKEVRATDGRFDVSDQIGVYARGAEERNNLHYHAIPGGHIAIFHPTTMSDRIYPSTVRELDFYAYAPYRTDVQKGIIHLNLIKEPLDLLWAHHREVAPRVDKKEYTLLFSHVLSRIVFTLQGLSAGVTLQSMQLQGMVVEGDFDVLTGELRAPYSSKETLPLTVGTDQRSASSLILPKEIVNAQLQLTLSNGRTYTKAINQLDIVSNKIYYYNITLDEQQGGISIDLVNGQIVDWEDDGTVSNIVATPTETPTPDPKPAGENIYGVNLTQTARALPLNDDFAKGGKDYDPFALPGWLNKALVGARDFQKRSYSGVHYAQASAFKSADPVNKCVLVTPRLQMTAGSSYTVDLTYSTGHTNGATLTVQQLDKDGALVKTLEVINDSTSPSGYGNQHYKKSYTIAGSAEAGYIAILYEASQEPLHTTTYQIEAVNVH